MFSIISNDISTWNSIEGSKLKSYLKYYIRPMFSVFFYLVHAYLLLVKRMTRSTYIFINKDSYEMDSLVVAIVTIIVLLLLFLLLLSLGVVVFVMIVKITGRKNLTQWTVWLLLFLLLLYCYYCYHLFHYWVPLCLSLLWKWQYHLPIPQTFY